MSKSPTEQIITAKAESDRAARLAREAAALRENLRRRKAQDRAREQGSDGRAPEDAKPPSTHGG